MICNDLAFWTNITKETGFFTVVFDTLQIIKQKCNRLLLFDCSKSGFDFDFNGKSRWSRFIVDFYQFPTNEEKNSLWVPFTIGYASCCCLHKQLNFIAGIFIELEKLPKTYIFCLYVWNRSGFNHKVDFVWCKGVTVINEIEIAFEWFVTFCNLIRRKSCFLYIISIFFLIFLRNICIFELLDTKNTKRNFGFAGNRFETFRIPWLRFSWFGYWFKRWPKHCFS